MTARVPVTARRVIQSYASSWRIVAEIETHPAGRASSYAVAARFAFTPAASVPVMVTLFPQRGVER